MTNKLSSVLTAAIVAVVFTNCSSNEIGSSKDVAQDKIYQYYKISYTEGDEKFKAKAQFRFAGSNGTTLVLASPANISFDYQPIKVDSSKFGGAFYEHTQDSGLMFAKHSFVYTDIDNKKYENGFFYNRFTLTNIPAEAGRNQPLTFNYSFEPNFVLQSDDYITVSSVNTDSSFTVTVKSTDTGGKIIIPVSELKRQKGNELKLEATLYRKIAMQQITSEGGEMELEYKLKPVKVKLKD